MQIQKKTHFYKARATHILTIVFQNYALLFRKHIFNNVIKGDNIDIVVLIFDNCFTSV